MERFAIALAMLAVYGGIGLYALGRRHAELEIFADEDPLVPEARADDPRLPPPRPLGPIGRALALAFTYLGMGIVWPIAIAALPFYWLASLRFRNRAKP